MSQQPEGSPLLVNSCVVEEESDAAQRAININSSIGKLRSPLGQHTTAEDKASPWYKNATVAVFNYAVAASFGALVTGCTLSFPSSAVLDLTDPSLGKEYRFDERLSDIFGVSKMSSHA